MKDGGKQTHKNIVWKRTKTQNLYINLKSGIYYARARVLGKPKFKTLKTKSFQVAEQRLYDYMKMIRRLSSNQNQKYNDSMTCGDAVDAYLQDTAFDQNIRQNTKRTRAIGIKKILNSWPGFERLLIKNVKKEDCQRWCAQYQAMGTGFVSPGSRKSPVFKPPAPVSVNKAITALQSIFKVGIANGIILESPARDLKRVPVKSKLPELPSKDQFAAFVREIRKNSNSRSDDIGDAVEFLAYSGARINTAPLIVWKDIDFKNNRIHIPGTKSATSDRYIPMVSKMQELLLKMRERRADEPESWFVLKVKRFQGSMNRAAQVVGMSRITHHDLRHYFATTCVESGIDIPTLSRWLGHSDGGALAMRTYGHLRDEHSQESAKKVVF